jgi:hypothetical protein
VPGVDRDAHRAEAVRLYNACWALLEMPARTPDDDATLLTDAFASRHHWREVGSLEQWTISDWMVARAAAATGHGVLAVAFARRAVDAARSPGAADWLVASSAEGLARAYAAAGDAAHRDEWCARAADLVAAITDEESRELIDSQLQTVPVV